MENLIERLKKISATLYREFGTDSYSLRCDIYDITKALEELNRTKVDMKNFKWEMSERKDKLICDGDLIIVNLPVRAIFELSDKIVADYDSETNTVLEHTSGYVMKVLPDQSFVYKGEESTFIASTFKEAQK